MEKKNMPCHVCAWTITHSSMTHTAQLYLKRSMQILNLLPQHCKVFTKKGAKWAVRIIIQKEQRGQFLSIYNVTISLTEWGPHEQGGHPCRGTAHSVCKAPLQSWETSCTEDRWSPAHRNTSSEGKTSQQLIKQLQICFVNQKNKKLPQMSDQVSDHGWGRCCWVARILRSESLPCQESAKEQHHSMI